MDKDLSINSEKALASDRENLLGGNNDFAEASDSFGQTPFRVLRGGLGETPADSRKQFVEAFITDTRLMGVTVMFVHWLLPDNMLKKHFYQFFHFDAEEFGLDEYRSVLADAEITAAESLRMLETQLLGGLGGKKNILTEREVRYLAQEYFDFNRSHSLPLPEDCEESEFLLNPRIDFSEVESYVLMCKQCPILSSPYQVINYFLMRCIGRDFAAAKFLTKNYVRTDLFSEFPAASFLRNVIDEDKDEKSGSNTDYYATSNDKDFGTFKTRKAFLCESLIEFDGRHFILITRVTLDQLNVVKYERISAFGISLWEASLLLTSPEYVSVYDMLLEDIDINENSTELLSHSMVTEHDCGKLFMIFYPHNDHVGRQTYRMSDDVFGLCYVLDTGQIVLASSSRANISALEQDFMKSGLSQILVHISKYAFDHPIMSDFISSNYEDFEDFVQVISESEDDDD